MSLHPVLNARHAAAVIAGASNIGLAAAKRFAASGLKVCMADPETIRLEVVVAEVPAVSSRSADAVLAVPTDVSEFGELQQFGASMCARFAVVVSVIGAMIIASSSAASAHDALSSHLPDGAINAACLPWQAPIDRRQPEAADLPNDFTPMPYGGRRGINTACLPWRAPIGHRQPGAADLHGNFTPARPELQALNKAIDRKLTICRGC
jgi:NAD(P)-dependent dehydrogenase (short-subunit alcohol dehydrogenase family)